MSSSLIPEKSLQISPSLAATIGLEEAAMLSVLDELIRHRSVTFNNGYHWLEVDSQCLQQFMPFWSPLDIQRIAKSLRDKGIIIIASAPYGESQRLKFAFNEKTESTAQQVANETNKTIQPTHAATSNSNRSSANAIGQNWQPTDDTLRALAQHNIPAHYALDQVPQFVNYWRERGGSQHSWGNKFIQWVKREWRNFETDFSRKDQDEKISSHWQPSEDALDILERGGISRNFCEDAVPEFILYWQERGEKSRTWNSRFINHVKRQWARFTSALEHDTEPKRIPENWTPGPDVFDVLQLANIDLDFVRTLVPEFVLFWRDSNQVHTSWNTKFVQHAKHHWAKRHQLTLPGASNAKQQTTYGPGRTKDRALAEHLTDRSWAY